jgi:dihydropteroate synthase
MLATMAAEQCGVVLMHTRGRPEEWRKLPNAPEIVETVLHDLANSVQSAIGAGVARNHIVVDPGFGFGKNFEGNYPLLAHFDQLQQLGLPLLAGTSRKGFIGRTLARGGEDAAPAERLFGTLASITACILKGAHIVRVHDVRASRDAALVADAILNAE